MCKDEWEQGTSGYYFIGNGIALDLFDKNITILDPDPAAADEDAWSRLGETDILLHFLTAPSNCVSRFPGKVRILAPKVPVSSSLTINRTLQIEHVYQALGAQVEVLADQV